MKRRTLVAAALACSASMGKEAPNKVKRLSLLTENEIDVASVALDLASEIYPEADLPRYSAIVTGLAQRVLLLSHASRDPEQRIRALNSVLFQQEGYRYDKRPFARSLKAYCFLTGILDTRQGHCVTLPMLYVAVAQRAGYPVYPVEAPDHVFARYRDPSFAEGNIECTNNGVFLPDANYIKRFAVSEEGIRSGAYMQTLTKREYLGELMLLTGTWRFQQGQTAAGFELYSKGLDLHSRSALGHANMGEALRALSRIPGQPANVLIARAEQHERRAQGLGYVPMENVPRSNSSREEYEDCSYVGARFYWPPLGAGACGLLRHRDRCVRKWFSNSLEHRGPLPSAGSDRNARRLELVHLRGYGPPEFCRSTRPRQDAVAQCQRGTKHI